MRFKPGFTQITANVWKSNKQALERKCLLESAIAKLVAKPAARELLYRRKADTLAQVFRSAQREMQATPKVRVDRRLSFKRKPVYSVRLRRGLWVHQPAATAADLFLVHANAAAAAKSISIGGR